MLGDAGTSPDWMIRRCGWFTLLAIYTYLQADDRSWHFVRPCPPADRVRHSRTFLANLSANRPYFPVSEMALQVHIFLRI